MSLNYLEVFDLILEKGEKMEHQNCHNETQVLDLQVTERCRKQPNCILMTGSYVVAKIVELYVNLV